MAPTFEQEEEFILNLGKALVKWQGVEAAAYALFRAFMKNADPRLVSVTFHHIQSFSSAVLLLDRCAYFAIPDGPLKSRWQGVKDKKKKNTGIKVRMDDQIKVRNRLVHFRYHTGMEQNHPVVSLGPSYFDATYAIKDRWKNPDLRLDNNCLLETQRDFELLAKDIAQLCADFNEAMDE